jgi:hypothetical protein
MTSAAVSWSAHPPRESQQQSRPGAPLSRAQSQSSGTSRTAYARPALSKALLCATGMQSRVRICSATAAFALRLQRLRFAPTEVHPMLTRAARWGAGVFSAGGFAGYLSRAVRVRARAVAPAAIPISPARAPCGTRQKGMTGCGREHVFCFSDTLAAGWALWAHRSLRGRSSSTKRSMEGDLPVTGQAREKGRLLDGRKWDYEPLAAIKFHVRIRGAS